VGDDCTTFRTAILLQRSVKNMWLNSGSEVMGCSTGLCSGRRGIARMCLILVAAVLSTTAVQAETVSVDDGESIQAAIDKASPGDVIEVKGGVYPGSLEINKRLVLRGMGMPAVQAKDSTSAINLSADGCVVEGFEVLNASGWRQAGIRVSSDDNIIRKNTVRSNSIGIFLEGSSRNRISENDARNGGTGILLMLSSNNTIEGNKASSRGKADFGLSSGIYLLDSCNHNTVRGNTVDTGGLLNMGILIIESEDNSVTDNMISGTGWLSGVGIGLLESENCIIKNNTAASNGILGQGIRLMSSSENSLSDNNVSCYGPMGQAFAILQSSHNNISGNSAHSWLWGLDMEFEGSWNNSLSANSASRIRSTS
jgi:parallel beta-helix repeat protein